MSKYFNWPSSLKRLVRFDAARAEDVNDALDELTAGLDQLDLDTDRSIKLPIGTADQTLAMTSGQRANLLLAFDSSGNIAAVAGGGRFRGDWLTATAYAISDYFRDPVSKNIYSVVTAHTSGVLVDDITAGRVQLAINVADVEAAKADAQAAATTAATQAGIATTQAGYASASATTATTKAGEAAASASTASSYATAAGGSAASASTSAATATTQAGIATTKAAEAAASAASIAGGPVPEAPSDGRAYGRKNTTWVEVADGAANIVRTEKTSTYTLAGADNGALIDCTGTWTLGMTAAATLGAGWWCYVRNSGAGDITLDPNSTETIDGIASFVLYPGAVRMVICDGAALRSIPLVGGTKTFTASGSYVWAPGVPQWDSDLISGGGGGGGSRSTTRIDGAGGGAGERYRRKIFVSEVTVGASTTCTVGAKGVGGAAAASDNTDGSNGTAGGTSSIGVICSAVGGGGGDAAPSMQGGAGGGKGVPYATSPTAQIYLTGQSRQSKVPKAGAGGVVHVPEWGGPAGRPGDSAEEAVTATLGGQKGGIGGVFVPSGTAGANGVNPGDAGNGGGGALNGSPAGKGGDGADGKITIVEVI